MLWLFGLVPRHTLLQRPSLLFVQLRIKLDAGPYVDLMFQFCTKSALKYAVRFVFVFALTQSPCIWYIWYAKFLLLRLLAYSREKERLLCCHATHRSLSWHGRYSVFRTYPSINQRSVFPHFLNFFNVLFFAQR